MGLIGLVGRAGVGKSSLANAIRGCADKPVYLRSMAAPLRSEIFSAVKDLKIPAEMPLDVTPGWREAVEQVTRLVTKPTSPSIRRLLQWWGTDYRRSKDPSYWLKAWARTYPLDVCNFDDYIIVDDVRFRNEAELVKLFGGDVVYLQREYTTNVTTEHASEQIDAWWTDDLGLKFELSDDDSPAGRMFDAQRLLGKLYDIDRT